MRKLLKQKKGQVISTVVFFAIVISVFIVAFLLMSFVNTILTPVGSQLGNISVESGKAVNAVQTSFNKWWDYAVIFLFALNIIILLLTAYYVDVHPMFLILYILAVFFLFVFGGNLVGALSDIWTSTSTVNAGGAGFSNAIVHMPLTIWILDHFTMVLLGIVIISGVVMYSKFKFGGSGGQY